VKISYLVTTHNETKELAKLLEQLVNNILCKKIDDELVILDDHSNNAATVAVLEETAKVPFVRVIQHELGKDFGAHKTYGSRQCNGEFIMQLDADEYLAPILLDNIHDIVDMNPVVELYRVPRVNIVRGLTPDDAKRWGWRVTHLEGFGNLPIINWDCGDYQSRLYKNDERIKWHKRLHETITGASVTTELPLDPNLAIIHDKTIERQTQQNMRYMKEWSLLENQGRE
jgi:glycosyltransferase involved in cell wall biosynthesis